MLVEKLSPPLGVPGKLPEDYRPGRPSIFLALLIHMPICLFGV